MRPSILFSLSLIAMIAISCSVKDNWTTEERALIEGQGEVMRVTKTDNEADLKILRTPSVDLPVAAIRVSLSPSGICS